MTFEDLFVDPRGRTSREDFARALAVLVAALAFYFFVVLGASSPLGMLMMVFPFAVLHARRLRDMGRPAWLAVFPGALAAAALLLRYAEPANETVPALSWAALIAAAGFALWGLSGKGRAAP